MALTIAPSVPVPSVSVVAALFLFDLPFARCPGKLSETGNSGLGHRLARTGSKIAMTNTRLRRWGIPKYCASSTLHSIANAPASAISSRMIPKSAPLLELSAPTTFSQIEILGYCPLLSSCSSLMILIHSCNKPDLAPSMPARLPATERSWHGLPHATTSTTGA